MPRPYGSRFQPGTAFPRKAGIVSQTLPAGCRNIPAQLCTKRSTGRLGGHVPLTGWPLARFATDAARVPPRHGPPLSASPFAEFLRELSNRSSHGIGPGQRNKTTFIILRRIIKWLHRFFRLQNLHDQQIGSDVEC